MQEVIFISDRISEEGLKFLEDLNYEIILGYNLTKSDWNFVLPTIQAWILESETRITAEDLEKARELKIIGRAGAGVDNIDLDAATRKGVVVENAPGGNTNAVAEHTIAMMLAISRKIPQYTSAIHNGEWDRTAYVGQELRNKVLGIIGLGRIGSRVARLANVLEMKVIAYDPYIPESRFESLNAEPVSLRKLLKESDYISLHIPLTDETAEILDKKAFSWMKDGVFIINCARGGLINEIELLNNLNSGKVAGAALDTFIQEPPDIHNPLLSHPNVICTPHMAGITLESQKNVTLQICEQIHEFFASGKLINTVNFPFSDVSTFIKMRPFLKLAERMGKCLGEICSGKTDAIEVNVVGKIDDLRPITSAFIAGFLHNTTDENLNIINAYAYATEKEIKIKETKRNVVEPYNNLITIQVNTGVTKHQIEGTVFSDEIPRITRLDNYKIEISLEGNLILLLVEDRPGVIGKIGTAIGLHERNILEFRLGRISNEPIAITALNIDGEITPDIQKDLQKIPEVNKLFVIENF